jgi:ABC-type bacteriocin/lantibiotic exporter with double-glycine peptidase domain
MSKRLVRIKGAEVFTQLQHQIGTELNAVLHNGTTHYGILHSIATDQLYITDPRKHSHKITISEIYEIIMDTRDSLEKMTIK